METIKQALTKEQLIQLKDKYGEYIKLTVDLKNEVLIAGCELHADGEEVLLKNGSQNNDIWGGGIDLKERIVDTMAVLNLRPSKSNDSMEILDQPTREKFIRIVKNVFSTLWT